MLCKCVKGLCKTFKDIKFTSSPLRVPVVSIPAPFLSLTEIFCCRQSFILVSTASVTSIFAGFAIFSILGHMATVQGKNMTDVVQGGPGLAFLAYPTGLAMLPIPQLWSVLFFGMLILVGVDSQFADLEGFITGLSDIYPVTMIGKNRKEVTTAVICFCCLIIGLPLLSNGGIYLFQLYNYYAASGICLLLLTFCESVAVGWIYGADRFYEDVRKMIGYYPSPYFKYCYRYFTPIITMSIFLFYCVKYKPLTLDDKYVYPWWANGIGWLMSLSSILCIPLLFIYTVARGSGSLVERIKQGLTPRLGNHLQQASNGSSTKDEEFEMMI